ncbi:MAG: hypothetical protein HKP61_04135 [Dactylosporangium sp.]|nr:hypothetical protein [Dactylosporangium sp.]NNJ60141.1 hypothetical protein [Dactylosporangium sp.]
MPLTAEAIRQTFCLGDYTGCARFQVDNAGKLAPPDLFPNQRGRIPSLLRTQDRTHARQQAEPDVS